jgi:hypothetical protein
LRRPLRPFGEARHFLHTFQESLTRRGELRAMGNAVKQLNSDLGFQVICWLSGGWPIPILAAARVK